MPSNIQVAALSDLGCVRTNNEDNFGYDPGLDLYVVCDGMGGMAAGEVASSIACSTVINVFAAQPVETAPEVRLSLAIRAANDAVWQAAQQQSDRQGMGTTLVAAVFHRDKVLIGNVGDSRAYLVQKGSCTQLTIDHSYLNEMIRMGSIRQEDSHTVDLQGMENVITRAIGAHHDVQPDFFGGDLQSGDTILLATDGLTRYVGSDLILQLIDTSDLEGSCRRLIETAKALGGADNITCLLLSYDRHPDVVPTVKPLELPQVETQQPVAETPIVEAPQAAFPEIPAPATEKPQEVLPEPPAASAEPLYALRTSIEDLSPAFGPSSTEEAPEPAEEVIAPLLSE